MSKGNPFLGKVSGSVGDITLYSRASEQITRRRARTVKNPRTAAQTLNRVIASTIGQAYSHMNDIVDHSFQGYSTKAENMQRFLKVNQQAIRKMLANSSDPLNQGSFQAVGQKGLVRFPFVLSEGSMPVIPVVLDSTAGANQDPIIPINFTGEQAPTYQDICDALRLKRGDQLTLCFVQGYASSTPEDPDEFWGKTVAFRYARIILDPVDDPSEVAPMTTPFFGVNGKVNFPNPRNVTDAISAISIDEGRLAFALTNVGLLSHKCLAFAAIASRKEGSTWLRSNSVLEVFADFKRTPTLAQAINASYPDTTGLTDPTKFLNAALGIKVG